MIDCHIHMVLDGGWWKDALARHAERPDEAFIRRTLAHYGSLGCTYLRDGGDRWRVGERAAELSSEYGIRYRTPCFPIYCRGHYGSFIGCGFETLEEYRTLVRQVRSRGGHFIKIMISGLMDFNHFGVLTEPPLEAALIADLVHLAHDEGFPVMAHANGDGAVLPALAAGVDSVEHGAYLSEQALLALAESGAVWCPTLSTVGNLVGEGRFPDEVTQKILAYQLDAVRLAASHGGLIACGSDAGAWAVPHGEGAQSEGKWLSLALGDDWESVIERGNHAIMEIF